MASDVILQPGERKTLVGPTVDLVVNGTPAFTQLGDTVVVEAVVPPLTPDPLVMQLQHEINKRGWKPALAEDGWFGPLTKDAIMAGLDTDMTPPPPPPPPVWRGFGTNENADAANGFANFDAMATALGRWPDWIRSFQTIDKPVLDATEAALRDRGLSMCHSLKLGGRKYADVAAGQYDVPISNWLTQVLAGSGRKDVCLNHEHNGPSSMSSGTAAQLAAAIGKVNNLLRAHKLFDPALHRTITIWIPWGFDPAKWPLDPATFQAYGADPYRWSSGSPTNWEPLVNHATSVINAAAAAGKPVCFPEYGVGHIDGHGAERAKTIADFLAYAKVNSDYACYFNGPSPTGDMPLKRDPEAWSTFRSTGLALLA